MTDTELDTLELCACGAMTDSWYTKTTSADDATAAFIAIANPTTILKLIEELRWIKAERNWIINRIIEYGARCPSQEDWKRCNEQVKTRSCDECWLQAAKEATCQK